MRISSTWPCWAVALLLAGPPATAAPDGTAREWQGRYRYEHDAGLTEGGAAAIVTYDLALGPAGARGGCVLTSRGFQTDERILCQAHAEGRTLTVTFHRYEDGRTVNKYGVAVYKVGQGLFTLSRTESGPDAELLTRWQALQPDGETVSESGAFFTKVR